jgi:hypothetical protein
MEKKIKNPKNSQKSLCEAGRRKSSGSEKKLKRSIKNKKI